MKVYHVRNAKWRSGLDVYQDPQLPQRFLQVGAAQGRESLSADDPCMHVPQFNACVVPDRVSEEGIVKRASIRVVQGGGVELIEERFYDTKNVLVFMDFESGGDGFVLFDTMGSEIIDCPNRKRNNYYTCLEPQRCAFCGTRGTGRDVHPDVGECFEPLEAEKAIRPIAFYSNLGLAISKYYCLYELEPGIRVRVRSILSHSLLWPEAVCDVHWDGEQLHCDVSLQIEGAFYEA